MSNYDPSRYRDFFENEFSYIGGFWRNVHRFAKDVAMIDGKDGTSWSYAQLGNKVGELAAGLVSLGVSPGEVVTYQLFNGPEFAQLYLACQAANVIGSPINYRLAAGETAFIIDDGPAKVFIYDTSLAEVVGVALEMAENKPEIVVAVGEGKPAPTPKGVKSLRFEELYLPRESAPRPNRNIYDETTRLYTSGTTGMPKGVPLNSAVEIFSAHDVAMHFPLAPDDRTLNMTPWFHRGGTYSGGPNPVFYIGASLVAMRSFDAGVTLDYTEKYRVTFLIGAPTTLEMIAAAQSQRPRDLSSLRGIVTMGAPLEREAVLRYQKLLTPKIFNGYGTTEAFWNTFLRPADLPEHAGSAGRACTDDDVAVVKLFDDRLASATETVAKDNAEIGEVIVRSPKSGFAYAGAGVRESHKYHQGWLHIGDLATWDADEFVTIVGRKDDMIISGGENVHPVQVEEVLNLHPGIVDSLVVGVPDETWGRLVVAYVVRSDETLTARQCDEFCRANPMLAPYKRPRAYRFVQSLPLTATGKKVHYVARKNAKDDYREGLFEKP